jgi:hypothetical protein
MKTTPLRYVPVVEDIARLINEILDKQEKVNSHIILHFMGFNRFYWLFQGASNTNNNQWTAGALKRI